MHVLKIAMNAYCKFSVVSQMSGKTLNPKKLDFQSKALIRRSLEI